MFAFLRTILAALFAAFMLIITSAVASSAAPSEGVVDHRAIDRSRTLIRPGESTRFIEPLASTNDADWKRYIANIRANQCGSWSVVVRFVKFHFENHTSIHHRAVQMASEESTMGDSLVFIAMEHAVQEGTMSPLCLVFLSNSQYPEINRYLLLSPAGDLIFSEAGNDIGSLVVSLQKLDRSLEYQTYDTLVIGDHYVGIEAFPLEAQRDVGVLPITMDIIPTSAPRSAEAAPRFEDYPAEYLTLTRNRLPSFCKRGTDYTQWYQEEDWQKRFQLFLCQEVSSRSMNFAGRYLLTWMGDGAGGANRAAAVDLRTGRVYDVPDLVVHWEFHANSRLLATGLANPEDPEYLPIWATTEYYEWTGQKFELIYAEPLNKDQQTTGSTN